MLNFLHNKQARVQFIKSAEAELIKLAKQSKMTNLEREKRVAYLKGVLHDIFLDTR